MIKITGNHSYLDSWCVVSADNQEEWNAFLEYLIFLGIQADTRYPGHTPAYYKKHHGKWRHKEVLGLGIKRSWMDCLPEFEEIYNDKSTEET